MCILINLFHIIFVFFAIIVAPAVFMIRVGLREGQRLPQLYGGFMILVGLGMVGYHSYQIHQKLKQKEK